MAIDLKKFREILEIETKKFPRKHPKILEALMKKYPHRIKIISDYLTVDYRKDCFLFAFQDVIPEGLMNKMEVLLDKELVTIEQVAEDLIDNGAIKWHDGRQEEDRVIIYFKDDKPVHFGINDPAADGMVISKWGIAHVWRHPVFEAPISYGDKVKYSNGKIDKCILGHTLSKYETSPDLDPP